MENGQLGAVITGSWGLVESLCCLARRARTAASPVALISHYVASATLSALLNKLNNFRGIAMHFDKLANTFLAGVMLVCALIWLNRRYAIVTATKCDCVSLA